MQRFGVEGCEAVLAGADALLARCAVHGTRRVELGMAHRGRLAMLATLLNKPPGTLFAKMENGQSDYRVGDVTYHLGETATLTYSQVSPCLQSESLIMWDAAWSSSICRSPLVPPNTSKGAQSTQSFPITGWSSDTCPLLSTVVYCINTLSRRGAWLCRAHRLTRFGCQ